MRILYVEDNKANLMLVERVAKMGGHEVINRTKGETAIADFATIQPDIVLMDIQLEGTMTGLQAVEKLRADGKKLPIIALTAYAMKGDREKAIDVGCDEYLPKPLPINKLVELLKKYQAESRKRDSQTAVAVKTPPASAKTESQTTVAASTATQSAEAIPPTKQESKVEPAAKPDVEPTPGASNTNRPKQQNNVSA